MKALCDGLTGHGFAPTGLSDPAQAVEAGAAGAVGGAVVRGLFGR